MVYDQTKFASQLTVIAKYFKEALIDFGRETTTNNVIDLTKAIEAVANEGDFSALLSTRARTARARYSQAVAGAVIKSLLDPVFKNYLRHVIGVDPNEIGDVVSSWPLIIEHWLFSSPGVARVPIYSIQSRGITRGTSPASSAGTGDGVPYRLTQDQYGIEVENGAVPLNIDLRCIQGEAEGADPGQELFSIGGAGGTDILDQGAGVTFDPKATLRALNSDGEFISDGSFQLTTNSGGNADPDDLGAWEDPTGTYGSAKYALDTTHTFMPSVEEAENGQAVSLEIKGSHTIQQELLGIRPAEPLFWTMRVRPGAALSAGGLTVAWGNQTKVLDLTSIAAGAFAVLTPPLDKNLFPYNFGDASNLLKLSISTPLAGDTVKIDNVRVGKMRPWGGSWWFIDPGATQFLAGAAYKFFRFADALSGTDSIIQRLLALAYGMYLPHVSAATPPTIPDPTA